MDATFQNAERIVINLLTTDLEFAVVEDHLAPMFVHVYTNVPNLFFNSSHCYQIINSMCILFVAKEKRYSLLR